MKKLMLLSATILASFVGSESVAVRYTFGESLVYFFDLRNDAVSEEKASASEKIINLLQESRYNRENSYCYPYSDTSSSYYGEIALDMKGFTRRLQGLLEVISREVQNNSSAHDDGVSVYYYDLAVLIEQLLHLYGEDYIKSYMDALKNNDNKVALLFDSTDALLNALSTVATEAYKRLYPYSLGCGRDSRWYAACCSSFEKVMLPQSMTAYEKLMSVRCLVPYYLGW